MQTIPIDPLPRCVEHIEVALSDRTFRVDVVHLMHQQPINVPYQPPRIIALLTDLYLSLLVSAERHVFVNMLMPYVMFGVAAVLLVVRGADELLPALGSYVVFGMTV